MHRILTKFVVACLFIMGDGAIAADNSYYNESKFATDCYSAELSKSEQSKNYDAESEPSSAVISHNFTDASNTPATTIVAANDFTLDLQSYQPYHPRAPPTPAK